MYSDETLLNHLEKCYKKHGKITHALLNQDDEFATAPTIINRFGSLSNAVEESELNIQYTGNYSDNELQEIIDRKQSEKGYISTRMLKEDNELPSISSLVSRFGSLSEARKELGIKTMDEKKSLERDFCNLEAVGYEPAPLHTYTISVSNEEDCGLYIGISTNLLSRLVYHRANFSSAMPQNGLYTSENDYKMIGIVDITPHNVEPNVTEERIAEIERKYFIEQVRKFETNNIGGGK